MRAHQDIAFRTACLFAGSAADAEEAAQEAFVKAWRALPRFRAGRAVPAVAAGDRRPTRRATAAAPPAGARASRCAAAARTAPRGTRLRLPRPPLLAGGERRDAARRAAAPATSATAR